MIFLNFTSVDGVQHAIAESRASPTSPHAFFSFVHIMSQKGAAEPSEMGTSTINVQMPRALHHEIHVDDLNQV